MAGRWPAWAAALGAASPAAAQRPARPDVRPLAHVRVESPVLGPGRAEWTVAAVRGDTLILWARRGERPPARVALADVTRLEVRGGARRNTLVGAALGLALGAGGGALYGADRPGPFNCIGQIFGCPEEERQARDPGSYAVLGAVVGVSLGALVGNFVVGDRWQRVVPGRGGRARVTLAPAAAGGVRAAVAVALP